MRDLHDSVVDGIGRACGKGIGIRADKAKVGFAAGPIPVDRTREWLRQIGGALAAIHAKEICHADLKPNNIMLSKVGEIKIIDYGLAWVKGEPKERVQGTPEYMAPEQSKHTTVNDRTDIYNFGATMYRMTTWRLPPSTVSAPNSPGMNAKLFRNLLKPVSEYAPQAPKERWRKSSACTPRARASC